MDSGAGIKTFLLSEMHCIALFSVPEAHDRLLWLQVFVAVLGPVGEEVAESEGEEDRERQEDGEKEGATDSWWGSKITARWSY